MLKELRIVDFAIVDEVTISFQEGFNVLTGETGAGKSILVGALQLAVGGRADVDHIRSGCDKSRIEAIFDTNRAAAATSMDLPAPVSPVSTGGSG